MADSFAQLVEDVKRLSTDEKQELHDLLEKYLVEQRRQEIADNHQASLDEVNHGKLTFSSDINALRETLSDG